MNIRGRGVLKDGIHSMKDCKRGRASFEMSSATKEQGARSGGLGGGGGWSGSKNGWKDCWFK